MNGAFRVGEFYIEPQLNTITRDDKPTRVEPKVMQVLQCLSDTAGEVVLKEQLMRSVWADTIVTDDVLTRAVSELRKAFRDDSKEPRYIQTIPKSGYRLIADVSVVNGKNGGGHVEATGQDNTMSTIPQARSRRSIWLIVFLMTALGATWLYLSQRRSEPARPTMRVVPFTSFPGREDQPALSPDGNQIAFAWNGEKGDNSDIYVKSINGDRPLRITSDPAVDFRPTWSPDGQRIAFLRFNPANYSFKVYVASALGIAPERLLFSSSSEAPTLSWSSDGKFIATSDSPPKPKPSHILLFSPETGEKRILTSPPDQYWADSTPAFSPDGQTVAFVRENTPITGDIYTVPINGGEPHRVTYDNARHTFNNGIVGGLAWTADGREIIFSSTRGGTPSLWRIPALGGDPERLAVGGDNSYYPTVSLRGNHLAYTQMSGGTPVYRLEVPNPTGQRVQPVKLLASTREDQSPRFSPDGKKIAFQSDRSGNLEIWLCDSEGQNLTQLTFFGKGQAGTPQWSPDGNQIAFDYRAEDRADIYLVSVAGGVPRRVTTESSDDSVPSWSNDGKYFYFASDRTGTQQIWKMPVEGGPAVQVTKQGGFQAYESADGKYLYYSKGPGPGVWRLPTEGGQEVLMLNQSGAGCWGQWALTDEGIYFINGKSDPGFQVNLFSFATQKISPVASLDKVNDFVAGLAISPDHHQILYTQRDPINSDIMLVENFH
ncbi:MAG TPA: winged helix-turn-helix domain-containing protein [Pyrinomonadaceae bacterium]|nr:winged helix-turn-helix domain-containing protein [Pyrinomonadaceae bacterium]